MQRPWQVLKRNTVYQSAWVSLHRDDVQLPDGSIIDGHHVVEFPHPAVCVVPVASDGRILMVEHYRFITDTNGWELPAGRVDPNEDLDTAAHRELREETGAICHELRYLGHFHPCNGSTNLTFHAYVGEAVEQVGEISDTNEIQSVAWFEPQQVWDMIDQGQILDGLTLTALLWYFAQKSRAQSAT
jgi:8-oxo-dGTP pyrophosphatase MutT (NUDIX family)